MLRSIICVAPNVIYGSGYENKGFFTNSALFWIPSRYRPFFEGYSNSALFQVTYPDYDAFQYPFPDLDRFHVTYMISALLFAHVTDSASLRKPTQ